jgi:hypothetical protein
LPRHQGRRLRPHLSPVRRRADALRHRHWDRHPNRRIPATRKIDIRVNALERQEEALIDCGVDPAHVIRAALRRAVKNWQLGPDFIAPSEEQRTRITEWRARTSLSRRCRRCDRPPARPRSPRRLSKWTLIRGQLEPRVWAEIDAVILDEIAERAAAPQEVPDEPRTADYKDNLHFHDGFLPNLPPTSCSCSIKPLTPPTRILRPPRSPVLRSL